jgi:formylglycine-generating enzyme required for sulfatase activity
VVVSDGWAGWAGRAGVLVCAGVLVAAPAGATEVGTGRRAQVAAPRGGTVLVPGGFFTMGLSDDQLAEAQVACALELGFEQREQAYQLCDRLMDLRPEETGDPREVYVSAFRIDRDEVTVAEYHACVQAGACDPTPLVAGDTRSVRDDLPVVNVTWTDARAYCAFAGGRLPTEAEWEKAARGDDGRHFPWGNVDADDRANRGMMRDEVERPVMFAADSLPSKVSDSDGAAGPAPPGSYRFGKSPYGVNDMAGNVAEWVADWYSPQGYSGLSRIDPRGVPTGTHKVVRGGSFDDPRFYSRTYHRRRQAPDVGMVSIGVRCAHEVR